MQYIIVGAGPAGVVAAETLRDCDPDAGITIIGDEPEAPYSRMAIPYYLIDQIGESGTHLRHGEDDYGSRNIEVLQNRVEKIDRAGKTVQLDDGSTRPYDKLLIATGSRPISPPIPGIDLPQVNPCWTLENARDIIRLAKAGTNVVLIGAGFIGSIVLEALVRRGVKLAVIETGNRMVPRMLNEKAGGLLQTWCIEKGVDVHTSCSVQSIAAAADEQVTVSLSDGTELTASLVISATGVKPNIDLVADAGIDTDIGILVNNKLQTSDPDIFAAGDVAQGIDFSTGNHEVQAIQPTATDHGRLAAMNMASQGSAFHGSLNMNVLDTLGLISCSYGLWMGVEGGEQAELYNPEAFQYISLQFDGDHLVGATSVGKTQHIGVFRGLIESKIDLSKWKSRLMADPTAIMEAYIGSTQELGAL